jgi:outer membrane protein
MKKNKFGGGTKIGFHINTIPLLLKSLVVFSAILPVLLVGQTDTISLQLAIELAEKNNVGIKISDLNYRESQSHTTEVKASRYPSLLFRTHYLNAPVPGYNEIITNNGEYGLQFTTSIPLYDGGARNRVVDQSATLENRSLISIEKTKVEIAFTVRTLYYDVLHSQGELSIREKTVERLQNYLSLLNQLRLGGSATESDVLKATVDLDNAVVEVDQSRQELAKGKKLLINELGLPLQQSIEVMLQNLSDSIDVPEFAVENSPDVGLLRQDKKFAEDDLRLAQSERLPVLTISGDAGVLGVKPYQFHQDIGYSLLLSLDIPLFTWGATNHRIEQKELEIQKAEAQLQLQQRELETEWTTTLNDLTVSRKNLIDYGRTIAIAEQNYLSAKARFAGGSASSLEVLDAQRSLVETQLNYNNTLYQVRTSMATVLRLSGKE